VLSPEGKNVGGVNPWFARAAEHAQSYDVGEGRTAKAVTPPYFLATKLVAFEDRGEDAQSSTDAEDIIALAVEVEDIVARVNAAGIRGEIAELWRLAMEKYGIDADALADLVDWHLDPRDREHRPRVVAAVVELARG
jgi:hypothetical protein